MQFASADSRVGFIAEESPEGEDARVREGQRGMALNDGERIVAMVERTFLSASNGE
jgi:hypothetical protein